MLPNVDHVIQKVGLPRSTALNKRLHEGTFGLDRMHQIVSRPLMHERAQRDEAEFLVTGLPNQIGIRTILAFGASHTQYKNGSNFQVRWRYC